MSEDNETDTLLVYVRREAREVVAFKVPKGWKPARDWDVVRLLNEDRELPAYQVAYWDPDMVKAWPDAWRIVDPGESVPKPWGPIDAREMIEKLDPPYDPEELRELTGEGAKAWAGVPDAEAWLRELRGGPPGGGGMIPKQISGSSSPP
jgi:hypothetical protein